MRAWVLLPMGRPLPTSELFSTRLMQDRLYPRIPAFASRTKDGGLRLVDTSRGLDVTAEGDLAAILWRALEGAPQTPLVSALGADHALAQSVAELAAAEAVELSGAAALALDGFDTLFVELTGSCNETCVHCYAESGPHVDTTLELETVRQVIADAAELGFGRVQLTGGDPLLYRDLVDAVRAVADVGIASCEIYTNGLLLSDELLDALQSLSPSFAFSFYSRVPAVHDSITRVKGSCELTIAAIRRVTARGLGVRAAIVALPENAATVEETVDFLRSLGVEQVGFSGSRAVGRGHAFEVELPGDVTQTGDAHHPGRRGGSACVTSNGNVVPCIFNRTDVLGRVPERRLSDVLRAPSCGVELSASGTLEACSARLQCRSCQLTALALRKAGR